MGAKDKQAGGTPQAGGQSAAQPQGGGGSTLGRVADVGGEVIKGMGLLAASAAIPGFGQSYVQAQQQQQAAAARQREDLLDNLRAAPRFALNPGVQKDIKRFFGDEALQQFVQEAERESFADEFIRGVLGSFSDDQINAAMAGGQPAGPTSALVGGMTGAPVSAAPAAPATPAAQPSPPAPPPTAQAPAPRRRARGRTAASAVQERLAPGQTVSVRHNGVTVTIKGMDPEEQAAAKFDGLVQDIAHANPQLTPEQVVNKASQQAVEELGFTGLPDEARTILTTGTIEQKRQWVQTQYERIRAREQTIGEREGRLEQPLTDDELTGVLVQAEMDNINAVLQARGDPPLNDQELAQLRLNRTQEIQNEITRERERTRLGAALPKPGKPEPGVRPLSQADNDFFTSADTSMGAWSNALSLMQSQLDNMGPVAGRVTTLGEQFGFASPEFSRMKVAIQRMVETTVRMLQGARASDADRIHIMGLFPNANTPVNQMVGKTVEGITEAVRIAKSRQEQLASQGFRVPNIELPPDLQEFLDRNAPPTTLENARAKIKRKR